MRGWTQSSRSPLTSLGLRSLLITCLATEIVWEVGKKIASKTEFYLPGSGDLRKITRSSITVKVCQEIQPIDLTAVSQVNCNNTAPIHCTGKYYNGKKISASFVLKGGISTSQLEELLLDLSDVRTRQNRSCQDPPLPVWTDWSPCSPSCGDGVRWRHCTSLTACQGEREERCHGPPCQTGENL